jgi:zinc protease
MLLTHALLTLIAPQTPAQAVRPPESRSAIQDASRITSFRVGEHEFLSRRLDNGVRAFVVQDAAKDADGLASIFVVISAGNRDESEDTTGLAHLTEHALYTGTPTTGTDEHDRIVQQELGGESNASTRDDYTIYYDHRIPVASLPRVLAMEVDRMANISWIEPAVLHERERLRIEELHTWNPSITREELLEHAVYQKEGYRWGRRDEKGHTKAPGIGIDVIRAFYETWYRPEHATVVVVTPGDPVEALDQIDAAFASWRGKGGLDVLPRPTEPKPFGPRTRRFESGLAQDRVEYCWVVPPRAHEDAVALAVLARALDRVKTSEGEPFQVSYHERQGSSLFRIAANGPRAAAELETLLDRLHEVGITAEQVADAQREEADRYSSLPLRARPYFSLAAEVARFGVYGEHGIVAYWSDSVNSLTQEAVVAAARAHLSPKSRVLVHFTAASDADAARELPTETAALAKFAQDAGEAGEYQLAVAAYTELLSRKPNKMNTVIYLATRGQLHMDKEDWDAAIADFEHALTVVDYPAVRDLLQEAKRRKSEGDDA